MEWIEGPNIPTEWEGKVAWKWVDQRGQEQPVLETVPRKFSRAAEQCGGVYWMLADIPQPPISKIQ